MDPSAVATPFIPPDIVLLTAPQLLGVMFNWGLWGILTVQVYLYHLCFNDSWRIKTLVYGLYVLECLQTALSSADIFHWFAFGWGRLEILADPYVNPIDLPLMAGVIALIVQLYFTWRIWVLGRSAILTVFIGAVSLTQAGAGIAAGIMAMQIGDLRALQDLVAPKIWLAGAALSDTLIAAAMTYFLVRARNNSHVPKTNFILKRIITLTIETNSLSASVAIITLALFIKYPGNSLFLCPPYALGKLYSNTLLVIFNNRMAMPLERSQQHASIGLSGMGSSGTALNHGGLHNDHHSRREDGIKITVLRESDKRDEHLRDSPTMGKRMSFEV